MLEVRLVKEFPAYAGTTRLYQVGVFFYAITLHDGDPTIATPAYAIRVSEVQMNETVFPDRPGLLEDADVMTVVELDDRYEVFDGAVLHGVAHKAIDVNDVLGYVQVDPSGLPTNSVEPLFSFSAEWGFGSMIGYIIGNDPWLSGS